MHQETPPGYLPLILHRLSALFSPSRAPRVRPPHPARMSLSHNRASQWFATQLPPSVDECNSSSRKIELLLEALASSGGNTRVSGDHNPIHVSVTFSSYANLTGTATHRMFSSGAVRSLVEASAVANIARARYGSSNFVGRVLPNHDIEAGPHHTRMASCRFITKVGVSGETGEGVLVGEAEFMRPVSAYILFTS